MTTPAKPSHVPVAILGAGLTGMTAAFYLRRAGVPFRIFEKLGHAGGHVITLEESGFRFDRTGHLLHLRDAEMRKLVLEWIGDDWVEVNRRSMVWSHGAYTRYPYQANTFGLPPDVANECLLGFIRAQIERATASVVPGAPRPEPENFEQFCVQNFGEGISKHFMIPYNARLWGVHPREITAAWCQRFVPLPKLEDVVAGAVGLNDRELGYNTSFVYPRLGIGELSKAMARRLPEIEYHRSPRAIDWKNKRLVFEDEVVTYDVLLSTAPLKALGHLLDSPPAAVAEANDRLRCNLLYYLDVATRVPSGTDHHWVYVPEEKYPFYRIGCYSHFSAALAPPGKACFYVELADRKEPDMAKLMPSVAAAMIEMGILGRAEDIEFARLRKIDYAYVVFDHAYFPSLAAIHPFLNEARILTAGRYGGWNYSSMEDALLFGRAAAEKSQELLLET